MYDLLNLYHLLTFFIWLSPQGDSGSSLACNDGSGIWHLVGITNWGRGCGQNPVVYARVSRYSKWIYETVAFYSNQ